MKTPSLAQRTLPITLSLLLGSAVMAQAATDPAGNPPPAVSGGNMEYKVISGFKQPFNDDLKYQTSKGWTPVGGVSVTSWNNDLYFAQLLGRPSGSGR
jgi:hypothetical protein